MSAPWPATLPQVPDQDGFSCTPQDNRLRTEMSAGPAKMRRRFTAVITNYTMQVTLTKTEYAAFQTFYDTTLISGTLPFEWIDPISQAAEDFRFVESYSASPSNDGQLVVVSMVLEVLP